jgi:ABC-type sugar transport system ATPase subunit
VIRLEDISVRIGGFALDGVSLQVPTGRYGVLMGRTGCGKTTLLESVIGLKTVVNGRIVLDDTEVTHLKPSLRNVGYVPQDLALFSTMTVRDHLALALRVRKASARAIRERVAELSATLGIEHLLERYPEGLSGGESQRVALGRALSARQRVLCLDEPLSALDDETHDEICGLLKRVQREMNVTVLHVTHRKSEAERLADCLFRFADGRVQAAAAAEGERLEV